MSEIALCNYLILGSEASLNTLETQALQLHHRFIRDSFVFNPLENKQLFANDKNKDYIVREEHYDSIINDARYHNIIVNDLNNQKYNKSISKNNILKTDAHRKKRFLFNQNHRGGGYGGEYPQVGHI